MNAFGVKELFAGNYESARDNFLKAASEVNATIKSFQHEQFPQIFCDVGILNAQAKQILVTISGTHGVEGYCGSALQTYLLNKHLHNLLLDWCQVHIHGLNPWGMKNFSRFNEENIDINRNFIDFAESLPINEFYPLIHEKLDLPEWKPKAIENFWLFYEDFVAKQGLRAWNVAFASGQYSHADGVMFGGHSASWSHLTLDKIINLMPHNCEKLIIIDLHTGVGNFAEELLFITSFSNNCNFQKLKEYKKVILNNYNLPINTLDFSGMVVNKFTKLKAKQFINLIVEYGTYAGKEMMEIILYDRWNRFYGKSEDEDYQSLVLEKYAPKNQLWQNQVIYHFWQTLFAVKESFV